MTACGALMLGATGLMGGAAADAAVITAGDGTFCAPTTRTIDTLTYATPLALSPRGHVVAEEGDPGALTAVWLHRPNGTKTTITFDDGSRPGSVSDVSGRGVTVGSKVHFPTLGAFEGWVSKGGTARWLQRPTSIDSYMAQSVNGSGAVVGVVTNYPSSSPGKSDFLADPIVWASADALPQELPMPAGAFEVALNDGAPLISVGRDGLISAVIDDYNSPASYLARWRPGAVAPTLDLLPAGWHAVSIAGRWVVGQIGATPNDMFVFSPRAAVHLDAANGLTGMVVSANGTYSAVYGPGSIFGRGTTAPRDGAQVYQAVDIVGTDDGTALRATSTDVSVISCTLALAEATYIDVTPVALGG